VNKEWNGMEWNGMEWNGMEVIMRYKEKQEKRGEE
jgi:hypothetical protein